MRPCPLSLSAAALLAAGSLLLAQNYAPPPSRTPDKETLKTIQDKREKLENQLTFLRQQGVHDPRLGDVEIYQKAAVWIDRHIEFYQAESGAWTVEALERGLLRASQAAQGESPWHYQTGRPVIRAYRSRLDGSLQPYAVTFPTDYGRDPRKKWRVDVVLHGRDPSLTEVKFLHTYAGDGPPAGKKVEDGPAYVRLDLYGRGNNAYRWAGENDVFEALDAFEGVERMLGRISLLDSDRIVLRGFSMGGAGTWHLGLHRPDRWTLLGPGAGFTSTHGYIKGLPESLPSYQENCLHIYDAVDYAENAFNVPVVAYSGDKDPQIEAARTIEARLKPLNIPMKHLVAPDMEHRFPPEWQKKAEEAYAPFLAKGKTRDPARVRFVTYTLKYPSCSWVEILSLDRHYQKTLVDAEQTKEGFAVRTQNVRVLRLDASEGDASLLARIDGQEVNIKPTENANGTGSYYLEKVGTEWRAARGQRLATDRLRRLQKYAGQQGPIDDAFTAPFLCVIGTGNPWHEATQRYADAALNQFQSVWEKYFRGRLNVKEDRDVSEADIANSNLILFGDPASNTLIKEVLAGLPLRWTREAITLKDKTYTAADHVPALIYPSPLQAGRYVVINSGHTFPTSAYQGTNALLYPRLGDYAVLKLKKEEKDPIATDVATAGLFNEFWQLGKGDD